MDKTTIEDIEVKGKKVFLRVDFNVPLDNKQRVTDVTRILAALPTIEFLLDRGARVILVSHLGRPKGKIVEELTLRPIATALESVLKRRVTFCPKILGSVAKTAIDSLKDGECLLLENVRFFSEEEKNDPQFAKELASLADKYVNDAFGTAHRAHASTEGVARFFDDAACGFLMNKELTYLGKVVESPEKPVCAILGGAKVSDKIRVISNLLETADHVLIGGGMAYSFLKYQGFEIGNSLFDEKDLNVVEEIFKKAEEEGKQIHLPIDHHVSKEFSNEASSHIVEGNIPEEYMGLDIGPRAIEDYLSVIQSAKTIIWNGPMGVFEMKKFQEGSFEIAKGMAACNDSITVVGGGDSVAAVNKIGLAEKMSHVSTGGGASLEFLEGKNLPGVDALADKK